MIERITDLPPHVVGLVAHGEITADDYRDVLEPALQVEYADGRRPQVLFVLDSDFTGFSGGALWADFRFGIGHLTGWDRIALVGDVDWITHAANLFKGIVPGRLKVFPLRERAVAQEWLVTGA